MGTQLNINLSLPLVFMACWDTRKADNVDFGSLGAAATYPRGMPDMVLFYLADNNHFNVMSSLSKRLSTTCIKSKAGVSPPGGRQQY